jgi:hypothetical protein
MSARVTAVLLMVAVISTGCSTISAVPDRGVWRATDGQTSEVFTKDSEECDKRSGVGTAFLWDDVAKLHPTVYKRCMEARGYVFQWAGAQ